MRYPRALNILECLCRARLIPFSTASSKLFFELEIISVTRATDIASSWLRECNEREATFHSSGRSIQLGREDHSSCR
jgi:hypothetical protein